MKISSSAFSEGERIPRQYSKDAENKSPPLHISGVPPNTRSLVLIVDDPDAPRGTYTHWIIFEIDPCTLDIGFDQIPAGARQGANDWGESEYGGPQPPSGEHRYFFRLYALDNNLDLPQGATQGQVLAAMSGHVLAQAELMGRFAASDRRLAA